jgi:hypothetical protein
MATIRFSRRTVHAAIKTFRGLTVAELISFLLDLGSDFPQAVGGDAIGNSNPKRLNSLMMIVDREPARLLGDGELLVDAIVVKAASLLPDLEIKYEWESPPDLSKEDATFLRLLNLDGFTVLDGVLRAASPADLEVPAAEDETTRLLNKHGFSTTAGHLKQALDILGQGERWAAANAQLRTFFDSMTDEIALRVDPSAAALGSGHPRRTKLAAARFFYSDLNEWDDKGTGFINGMIKRLHPQGSHPGLSDENDAIFRMQIVLMTARLLLQRFDAGVRV